MHVCKELDTQMQVDTALRWLMLRGYLQAHTMLQQSFSLATTKATQSCTVSLEARHSVRMKSCHEYFKLRLLIDPKGSK